MVIANDQRVRLKIPDQELGDIIFGRKLGKFFCKWNDHQMVDAEIGKKFYFFIDRTDEMNACCSFYNGPRMWIKSDNNRFAAYYKRLFSHLFNNLTMACMDTVKCPDSDYGITKKG